MPLLALEPASKLFGFPQDHMNPTVRMMARFFGIRNVVLAAFLYGGAQGWVQLPFLFLLNMITDAVDAVIIVLPLVRRQGLDRAAASSLVLAIGATTAFLVAWLKTR
jgi:hypothetical protein